MGTAPALALYSPYFRIYYVLRFYGDAGRIRTDGKGFPVHGVAVRRLTTWLQHH